MNSVIWIGKMHLAAVVGVSLKVLDKEKRQSHVQVLDPGFTKPVGTGPVSDQTGPALLPVKPVRPGSGLDRYQTGPNSKFKFKFKK